MLLSMEWLCMGGIRFCEQRKNTILPFRNVIQETTWSCPCRLKLLVALVSHCPCYPNGIFSIHAFVLKASAGGVTESLLFQVPLLCYQFHFLQSSWESSYVKRLKPTALTTHGASKSPAFIVQLFLPLLMELLVAQLFLTIVTHLQEQV